MDYPCGFGNRRTGKIWSQRLRIGGKPVNLGLGSVPRVTLALARARALDNVQKVEEGIDPRFKPTKMPSFSEAVEIAISEHEGVWRAGGRQAGIFRASMERFAYPALEHTPIDKITTADLRFCVLPTWSTKTGTARLMKRRFVVIMRWSIGAGHQSDDPAGVALDASLPKFNKIQEHQRAVPHSQMADTLATVESGGA
jgi:hypothetical protein